MGGVCGGGFDSVGSANTPGNDRTEESGNSLKEILANFFTPNDNMKYEDGVLMNTSQGEGKHTKVRDEAGAFTNIPDKSNINVTNTNRDDRIFDTDDIANFEKQENSLSENLANFFKPFDGAKYIGGNLIDEKTGRSLTGGGYATNKAGVKNYIYGVADDFTNNAQPKQGGMSNKDYAVALEVFKRQQSQLQNIAPSNAEYFTSFLPGLVSPGLGGFIGNKMLEGGINARRANMDQHQAALDGGAEAIMENGVYLGYNKNGTFMPYIEEPTAPVVNTGQSDGNNSQDPLLNPNRGALNPEIIGRPVDGYGPNFVGSGSDQDIVTTDLPDINLNEWGSEAGQDAILRGKFLIDVLPGLRDKNSNMTQKEINDAFLLYKLRTTTINNRLQTTIAN